MASVGEAGLMAEARGGNTAAFETLLHPLIEPGYRLAFTMLGNREDAEDAVQEAAVRAWRHIRGLRVDTASLRPWFLTIVANQCRSMRRRRWLGLMPVLQPASEPSLRDGLALEDRVDLRSALGRLSSDQRLVLYLRFNLDLDYPEMGRILGVSAGGAKSRLHRALRTLQRKLAPRKGDR